jgi:hypothetical protein
MNFNGLYKPLKTFTLALSQRERQLLDLTLPKGVRQLVSIHLEGEGTFGVGLTGLAGNNIQW